MTGPGYPRPAEITLTGILPLACLQCDPGHALTPLSTMFQLAIFPGGLLRFDVEPLGIGVHAQVAFHLHGPLVAADTVVPFDVGPRRQRIPGQGAVLLGCNAGPLTSHGR
ncbi:hypothetical protein Ddc_21565 [Ditylenchus destructor]|nr:hypothetical protein Ddc_21565 [Ditylenchus destructor]